MSHLLALLLSSAPSPVTPSDLCRFPPAQVVCAHREAAHRNLNRLKVLRSIEPREQIAVAVDEAQYAAACWDALETAHRLAKQDRDGSLDALAGLRHLLREGAWRAGAMPPLSPR